MLRGIGLNLGNYPIDLKLTQGLQSNERTASHISSYQQLLKDEWRPKTFCCGLKGSTLQSELLQWKSYKEHSIQTNGKIREKLWYQIGSMRGKCTSLYTS